MLVTTVCSAKMAEPMPFEGTRGSKGDRYMWVLPGEYG